MFEFLKRFGGETPTPPQFTVPAGERIYAIGDIHGRLDLFEALIGGVEADDLTGPATNTTVILLGDLVDRGPDSAGVIDRARRWQSMRKVRILTGNHEEMFLRSFKEIEMLRHFLRHGGRETVMSFGVSKKALLAASIEEVQYLMYALVPQSVRDYLSSFEDIITVGDYLFVHAGINPALPIEDQKAQDLRWIREPFLSHTGSHGKVVVHGHTITAEPQDMGNRIGIDTGAYGSGKLTALIVEGSERRYLEAVEDELGRISVRHTVAAYRQ